MKDLVGNKDVSMSKKEMDEFLKEPRIARVAVVRKDGSPHISPVWFDYDGNHFYINTTEERAKSRILRKNDKVALTIDTETRPHKGVIVEGIAEPKEKGADEDIYRIAMRYLGKQGADNYIKALLAMGKRITYRITPKKIITWDFSKR